MTRPITLRQEIILGILLIAILALRIPSLFEPFWYGDEGIFAAVGHSLLRGAHLYSGAWDNKPPLIYLTYETIFRFFGVSMFWLRLVAAGFVVATGYFIFEIARNVLTTKKAFIALVIFAVLQAQITLEANLALTEIFLSAATVTAFWIFIRFAKGERLWPYYLCGLALGAGFLYKQVGALDAAALGFFIIATKERWFSKDLVLAFGFLTPLALTVAMTLKEHILGDFIFAAFTYYRIYLGEGPGLPRFFGVAKILPAAFSLAFVFWRKKKSGEVPFVLLFPLWMGFAILGALFSGRPYGHYLVQIFPPVALTLAALDFKKLKGSTVAVFLPFVFVAILILSLAFAVFVDRKDPLKLGYWHNFFSFVLGGKTYAAYSDYFDPNARKVALLSNYLKTKKAQGRYVYIWGDYPWLYATADVKNTSRYVTSFHVFGVPGAKEEVLGGLQKTQPDYIVIAPNNIGQFDALNKLIKQNYSFDIELDGSIIYTRKRN